VPPSVPPSTNDTTPTRGLGEAQVVVPPPPPSSCSGALEKAQIRLCWRRRETKLFEDVLSLVPLADAVDAVPGDDEAALSLRCPGKTSAGAKKIMSGIKTSSTPGNRREAHHQHGLVSFHV